MNTLMKWTPMEELVPRSFLGRFWDRDFEDVFEAADHKTFVSNCNCQTPIPMCSKVLIASLSKVAGCHLAGS